MGSVATHSGLAPEERAELEWLLQSRALGRSANLSRVLRYLCDETAAGRADQIKEYSIAVEALGRRADFDPQTDTIVRVTLHTLRKRLLEFYEHGEGASHRVHVVIPTGGYSAVFLHRDAEPVAAAGTAPAAGERAVEAQAPALRDASPGSRGERRPPVLSMAAVALLAVAALATFYVYRRHAPHPVVPTHARRAGLPLAIHAPVHLLLGEHRHAFTDGSGVHWQAGQEPCEGGDEVAAAPVPIAGTEDQALFQGGVRGLLRCTFLAPPGFYEVHLFFAEPGDLPPAQRSVNVSVNAGTAQPIDVVDRAGADRTATGYTIAGIAPENDGTLHLDFSSEVTPVNAIEIVPTPSAQPLPFRMVASPTGYTDDAGNVWSADRFFHGGRHGQAPDMQHRAALGLYGSSRVGSFRYALPVGTGYRYRVTLYFREPWFRDSSTVTPVGTGQASTASAAPHEGRRVFSVYANGAALLRDFDILQQGAGGTVVRSLDGVEPTPQGLLLLDFVRGTNYPLVSAISVEPEPLAARKR